MTSFPEYSFSAASKIASLIGTLVYRDVASKEKTTSSWLREMFLQLSTVWFAEPFIFESGIADNHSVTFCATL